MTPTLLPQGCQPPDVLDLNPCEISEQKQNKTTTTTTTTIALNTFGLKSDDSGFYPGEHYSLNIRKSV